MNRKNLYNVIPLETTIIIKLQIFFGKSDALNPVNLTDWSMTCSTFVMQKRKPHLFGKSHSEEEKPANLFYTIT